MWLMRLSQTLAMPLSGLIARFFRVWRGSSQSFCFWGGLCSLDGHPPMLRALRREYERLQQQLADQEQEVRQRVQRDAIATLESWLVQWPTAVYAAQNNPRFIGHKAPSSGQTHRNALAILGCKLPLARLARKNLLIPTIHQPREGNPQVGQIVRIRNVGYRHGEKIVYRAKVSPSSSS